MTISKTLMTADEFYEFCCRNDGRYELVDGKVVEMAPANEEHGAVALNIGTGFNLYSRLHGTGRATVETGHVLRRGPDTVRGPDVTFILTGKDEWESLTNRFSSGAPDIAVEVFSPSNTHAEMRRKIADYFAAGSQRVWVAYPSTRSVNVHRADGTAITYAGDDVITDEELLPGFSLPLSDVFR